MDNRFPMKKNITEFNDIQIYTSEASSTNVTIGEWKGYRYSLETAITQGKRLCTYADLVCDYIKLSREVLAAFGITALPNVAEDAINSIIVVRGRECIPYAVASRPESLYVRLQYIVSGIEKVINFNFSGELGDFPKITCEDTYDDVYSPTGTSEYKYNTIIAYVSADLDTESDNNNTIKKLQITLNNFDLIPYVYTDTEVNYKNYVGETEAQNIGILTFDENSSSQVANPRKLCFNIKSIESRLSSNPTGDKKYLYNLYPILKFGGFSKEHSVYIPETGTVIYGRGNEMRFYNSDIEEYKKIYPEHPEYDYGGSITLTYKPYSGAKVEYDLLKYFDDDDPVKTMRPHDTGEDAGFHGFFTPGIFDGVANIVVDAQKNNPVQVTISTNGKVMVRNLSEYNLEYDPNDYDEIKSIGQMLIMIPDSFSTAYTPIYDPGRLTLGILPKKKDSDYDKFDVYFYVNDIETTKKTIVFETNGYVIDVNLYLNNDQPFDPNSRYKIVFKALRKYTPKNISLKEYT